MPRPQAVRDAYAAAIGLPFDEYGRSDDADDVSLGLDRAESGAIRGDPGGARLELPTPEKTLEAHLQVCYGLLCARCEVERIDAPALVLHGDDDLIVPVENGRMLAVAPTECALRRAAGSGHNLQLEDPETFNSHVLDFLSS